MASPSHAIIVRCSLFQSHRLQVQGDGNQFYSLFRDSKGFYWFGGANGLIRFTDPAGERHDAIWYRMGDKTYPLSHNRIRHIYEDKEQQLWIATDGSINRYDYATRQFIHYNIVDNTGTYNTNWTYYIFEDTAGQLWISTCLGGIFVVDKHKLMQSTSGQYIAEQNYPSTTDCPVCLSTRLFPIMKAMYGYCSTIIKE